MPLNLTDTLFSLKDSIPVTGSSHFAQSSFSLASMHTLIIFLPCPKTNLVHRSLDLPVPILILHCSEMALDSQQHLHISCHRVVKQGIGMPLGELQSLLQKEVICKAMTKITTEFPILALQVWHA